MTPEQVLDPEAEGPTAGGGGPIETANTAVHHPPPASPNPLEDAPIGGAKKAAALSTVDPRSLAATGGSVGVDEKVEARFSNGEWYPATVAAVNGNQTYSILFDDGFDLTLGKDGVRDPASEGRRAVDPPQQEPPLRQPEAATPAVPAAATAAVSTPTTEEAPIGGKKPSLVEADSRSLQATGQSGRAQMAVEAMFSNGEWYPATITAVHPDGRYGVLFEDGFEEPSLTGAQVRDPNARPAPPLSPIRDAPSSVGGGEEAPLGGGAPLPSLDDIPIGGGNKGSSMMMDEFPPGHEEGGMQGEEEEMAECEECGRRMRASALAKHMNIHKTRKKFNSKARMVDKEARNEKRAMIKAGDSAAKAPKPKSKGAEQSRMLREAMKAVRDAKKEEMMKAQGH